MDRITAIIVVGLSCLFLVGCTRVTGTDSATIIYRRTGGIVNLDDQLRLYADGRAELSRKGVETTFTIDPDQVAQLTSTLDQIPFSSLRSAPTTTSQGADHIQYELRYQQHTVRLVDTQLPDALLPVLEELDGIILHQGQP